MSKHQQFLYALLAVVSVLVLSVEGQGVGVDGHPVTCPEFTPHSELNITELVGVWYGASRSPAHKFACVEMKVALTKNDTMVKLTTSHAALNSTLLNTVKEAMVNVADLTNPNGFTVLYNSTDEKPFIYKIIEIDPDKKYAVMCGYTSPEIGDESFGLIMTGERIADKKWLQAIKDEASKRFADFAKDSVVDIQQSDKCASSAEVAVPVLSTILGVVYSLLRFMH
uniref:Lipocalin/cytosolic fatty-acid binding domain-containing protein n=1 Tax=Glossina pallidipes TaxID=7398 RepID=A0A1A9Z4X1_GLOPL